MPLQTKQIIRNICPIYKEPNKECPLESELLFGDYFYIKILKENWAFGNSHSDNYKGWVELQNLGQIMQNNHKVIFLQSLVYKRPDIKSNVLFNLFLGSKIAVIDMNNNWAKIKINNKSSIGFINTKSLSSYSLKKKNWVSIAENFLGVPYKWGGKSLLGIDCSGLVQLAIQLKVDNFPRNTNEQIKMNFDIIKNQNNLRRGDLIFWDGHVGVMQNQKNVIHANQFHMKVVSEKLTLAIKRINAKTKSLPTFKRLKEYF
jgi:hypothetical protein